MDTLHVGCSGFVGPRDRYWRFLDAWELGQKEERTTLKTLGRWRGTAPERARFVPRVCASVAAAGFAGEEAEAGWARTLACAERLGAGTVLLRTGSDFRPTSEHRAAMYGFFNVEGRLPEGLSVAWWAEGLWAYDDHLELCTALQLTPAIDPLGLDDDETPPPGAEVYWRMMGRKGLSGGFSDYDLDVLLGHLEGRTRGYVVFTTPQMMRDARHFAELAGVDPADG